MEGTQVSRTADVELSICIPTLNRGAFIGATLESIISQTTPEVEIVVVDGGSKDETAAVVQAWKQRFPRLAYYRADVMGAIEGSAPSNAGYDRDCNWAVELATGQYCWLLPDDDVLKPRAIDLVLGHIRAGYSLVVANAEVRTKDLSKVIDRSRLAFDIDRTYESGDGDQLLGDTGAYLSYMGGVVVRRDLWLAREREKFVGSGFIHFGVIFQDRLPSRALAIAEPIISIRAGNAHWSSRWFQIWMSEWPALVWSLNAFSDEAKARVCPREPARKLGRLLTARALGAYSLKEYRTWLAPRLVTGPRRVAAKLIALAPGALLNALGIAYFALSPKRSSHLSDLKDSRFFIGKILRDPLRRWRDYFDS